MTSNDVRAFKYQRPSSCVLCSTLLCHARPPIKTCSDRAEVGEECCPADRSLRSQEVSSTDLGIEHFLNGSGYNRDMQSYWAASRSCAVWSIEGCWKMGFLKCDAMGSRIHVPVLSILLIAITSTSQKKHVYMVCRPCIESMMACEGFVLLRKQVFLKTNIECTLL